MVALLPADPAVLVLDKESATPAPEIHLTLVYLGDDVTGWDTTRRQLLRQVAIQAAATLGAPIEARVMGHATFNPDGGPDGDRDPCAVHLIGDSDRLAPARRGLTTTLTNLLGEDFPEQHEPFIPHTTAGFGIQAGDLTYCGPVVFDRLVLALSGDWQEFPLTTDPVAEAIRPYARTAYAQGFARSGGPMTAQVKAGCIAAVALAVEHAHEPWVLEATLNLGALEGVWAAVYARREKLVAQHLTVVAKLWRRSAHRLAISAAVTRYFQSMGLSESVDVSNTDHRRMVAMAIAQAVAQGIAGEDALPADRDAIVTAISRALIDAEAEGYAAAVVVGAEQLGVATPGFGLVFDDAHAALGDLGSHWGDASGWLGRMVGGNSTDLGSRLSALAADGASYEEMVAAAADIIGGDDIRAVSTILDLAMGQSFSRGALSLYAREGVQQVDYITAGGLKVCPLCINSESGNPWDRNSVPVPPLHPYCRCVLQPTDPMQGLTTLLANYATIA